jgi:hypothetical protein
MPLCLCCLSVTIMSPEGQLGLWNGNEGLVFRNRFHWFLRLGKRTHQLPLQRRSTSQLIIHLNKYHRAGELTSANLIAIQAIQGCHPSSTVLPPNLQLRKDDCDLYPDCAFHYLYRGIVGSLGYLFNNTGRLVYHRVWGLKLPVYEALSC